MPVDLNQLRHTLLESQRMGESLPATPSRQIVVDRDGNVILGTDAKHDTPVTVVPQEIFAGEAQ